MLTGGQFNSGWGPCWIYQRYVVVLAFPAKQALEAVRERLRR